MRLWWYFRQSFLLLIIPIELCMSLKPFYKLLFINGKIYTFGHVLTVNRRCYGRCYVRNYRNNIIIMKLPRNWIWDTAINCRGKVKKCSKIYNARAQPLFFSLNLLFSDVPVVVAVSVFQTPYWSCHSFHKLENDSFYHEFPIRTASLTAYINTVLFLPKRY